MGVSASDDGKKLPLSQGLCGNFWANGAFWFLIALVIFCTIGNIVWLQRNLLTIPPPWDQAWYLRMSLRYYHSLWDGGPLLLFKELVSLSPDTAPLFPLTALPMYLLFGPTRLIAHLTNSCYLLLLLLGIYRLGEHIYSQRVGILAAFFTATFTAVVNFSRDYMLEFPSAAFVTLGLYAMIRSDDFEQRSWALKFGVFAGLALLTKTMAGVFFIGPILYSLGRAIRQGRLNSALLFNVLLAVSGAVIVASVWWGPNLRTALRYLIFFGFREGSVPYSEGGSELLTLKNLTHYFYSLVGYGTSFFYALLLALLMLLRGVVRVFRWARKTAGETDRDLKEGYLWIWLVIGYALLTVVPNKGGERYALALLPPIALLLAGSIEGLGHRWLRQSVTILAIAIGAFNYIGLTYGWALIPQRWYFPPWTVIGHEYPHYSWVRSTLPDSTGLQWPIHDILSILADDSAKITRKRVEAVRSGSLGRAESLSIDEEVRMLYRILVKRELGRKSRQRYADALREGQITRDALIELILASPEFKALRAKVLVVPDHPLFNPSTLHYYAEMYRFPLVFSHISDNPIGRERLQEYDFVLVKNGGYQGPEFSTRYNHQILDELLMPKSGFVVLPRAFVFPDQSQISIFATNRSLGD
jgi:4-amino-4-deoxy-L-arabinose transferase-like glycosyltransferase